MIMFGVCCLGFQVEWFGFRVLSLGFGVWGLQGCLAHKPPPPPQDLGVLGFGFWVWELGLGV